ncbi:MAG TPA: cupin domain-containing protein [Candidatus Caldiarchaeum subterraneum]|uniref:Cupin domain-containing protein n=1 Tax=Caldiarchaeum subterraneum TaxID=311458 RepID=A0A833EAV2_CALS0|nr:cupin domain-containing protein [Aigarchaeota archaeon]HIQ30045.1 cupin domain-containing protein [Candidatus Caldarchaeum subterraneum]
MVYVVNVGDVGRVRLEKGEAEGVWVRYLVGEEQGAGRFYLRLYEVEPGGRTPLDRHVYEHEVYILQGVAALLYEENGMRRTREVKQGDVIFIASDEMHQFINIGEDKLVFLCVRGAERIYGEK